MHDFVRTRRWDLPTAAVGRASMVLGHPDPPGNDGNKLRYISYLAYFAFAQAGVPLLRAGKCGSPAHGNWPCRSAPEAERHGCRLPK